MVSEVVSSEIPAVEEIAVLPDEGDVADDLEAGNFTFEAGNISEFQRMCSEYIASPKKPKAFIDALAVAMFNDERVRKICRVRALKNGADLRDTDEVLQRVMIVFFDSQLAKLREADAVYAVVYAIANNVSREVVRDSQVLTANHDSIEAMRERGEDLEQVSLLDTEQQDRDQELDSQIAAAKMAKAFQRLLNGEQKLSTQGVYDIDPLVAAIASTGASTADTEEDVRPATKARGSRGRLGMTEEERRERLSPDQRELVEIGDQLGLRNQDYAAALGIGLPRLSSYIYGRTASVPTDIMDLARKMRDEDPEAKARQERFNRPMSEILDEWAKDLNIDNDQDLAVALGVTKMTVFRWRNNETKPDTTSLSRYEQYVRRYKSRLEEAGGKTK